jgi:hypothetical protein
MVIILPFIQISFLMRMIDLIGKHPPINVLKTSASGMSSLEMSLNEDNDDIDFNDLSEKEVMPLMKIICQFAREVLLSHVKKDVNLTVYPGSIQFPGDLYSRRKPSSTSPVNDYAYKSEESDESSLTKAKKPKKSISHYVKRSQHELPLSDSDQSDDEDKLNGKEKSHEKHKDSVSDDTYEHSPSFSPVDELEESSRKKPKKGKISCHVKKSHDEMPSMSDQLDEVDKIEDEDKSPEQLKDSLSGDTYEHSPSFSRVDELEESSSKKPKKAKISYDVKKSHDEMPSKSDKLDEVDKIEDEEESPEQQKDSLSGDTYEHSPSFSPSASTPGHGEGFDSNFDDVSPLSRSNSPAVIVAKVVKKRPPVQSKKSKSSVGKFMSKAIDVSNEFPTPATDAGDDEKIPRKGSSSKKTKATPEKAVNSAKKLKSTPRASKGSSSKKTKATPVSIPKTVMVNVTNSTTTSSRSGSVMAASKRKATKTKVAKSADEEDDFDFSDSPVKPKSTGRSGKKSSSVVMSEKAAPARKARAPAKSKVVAGKKTSLSGNYSNGKSPSTTFEASSGASPVYRAGRRGARAPRA